MTVKRMDNVGIVVEDLDAAIEFFTALGLELEGRAPVEGDWADGVTGLHDMRVEIAVMRTPDGHSRLELSQFEPAMTVWRTHHGDFDAHVVQSSDAICPVSFDWGAPLELETKFGEEPN